MHNVKPSDQINSLSVKSSPKVAWDTNEKKHFQPTAVSDSLEFSIMNGSYFFSKATDKFSLKSDFSFQFFTFFNYLQFYHCLDFGQNLTKAFSSLTVAWGLYGTLYSLQLCVLMLYTCLDLHLNMVF